MSASPTILYVSPFPPVSTNSASEVRSLKIAQVLQQIGRVQFIVTQDAGETRPCPSGTTEFSSIDTVTLRARPNDSISKKLGWLVNPRSPTPHGVDVDGTDLQKVSDAAKKADLVWFFKLRTANAFARWSWPRSVVDIDDVPSLFERSTINSDLRPSERLAARMRVWSWSRRERLLGERFNAVAVCSEPDRQYLRDLDINASVHVIPNGFDRPAIVPVRHVATPPRVGFIGVFDHAPNVSGVQWFVRECWPRIKSDVPDARLRLVGRLSDGPLAPRGPDIDGLGWLSDPTDEIASWSCTIVPVHVGAGTRGKIAHAFSQKCPVVSTPLGAYGYDVADGREMFLAEMPQAFADACLRAIREPGQAAEMAERAWDAFLEKWTWDAIAPRVHATVEDGMRGKPER